MQHSFYLKSFWFLPLFFCIPSDSLNVCVLLCVFKHELCQQDNLLIRENENERVVIRDRPGLYLSQYTFF